jgi:hypothetical protein
MVERCPSSVFKGKAVLRGYRWQINQRGVANVIASQEDYVEGLLFSIGEKDEKTLDRNEGVSGGFYEKAELTIEARLIESDFKTSYVARKLDIPGLESIIGSASKPIIRRTNSEMRPDSTHPKGDLKANSDGHSLSDIAAHIADGSGNEQIDSHGKSHLIGLSADLNDPGHAVDVLGEETLYEGDPNRTNSCGSNQNSRNDDTYLEHETTTVKALVYLSNTYRNDGNIREECVARMKNAMADAEKLGISSEFLNKYLKPAIYDPIIIGN